MAVRKYRFDPKNGRNTVEQIRAVVDRMPSATDVERRDRAVIAFTLLTGARDGATIGFRLRHIDIAGERLEQDAREVATKQAKTFTTFFFPMGDDFKAIVADWVHFLRTGRLWGENDPPFPVTEVTPDEVGSFAPSGLARRHWTSASPMRAIFRSAFEAAGLPYANPHSFRSTIVQEAYRRNLSAEELKAWSQNLGHEGLMTTFGSYGAVSLHRHGGILRGAGGPGELARQRCDRL